MSESSMRPARAGSRRSSGFTLIEVIIALMILTIGVLGLASATLYVVRQTTLGEVTTERVVAVQSVIEELRARPYEAVQSESPRAVGEFTVGLTVSEGTKTKLVTITTTGPGLVTGGGTFSLGSGVQETFEYRIAKVENE